jgi:hypothetical protein
MALTIGEVFKKMLYLEMEHLLKAMDTLMKESGATTYLMD